MPCLSTGRPLITFQGTGQPLETERPVWKSYVCSALVFVTHRGISLLWLKSSSGGKLLFFFGELVYWRYLHTHKPQTHARMNDISCKGSTSSVSRKGSADWGHERWVTAQRNIKPQTLHGFCPFKSRALTINTSVRLHDNR